MPALIAKSSLLTGDLLPQPALPIRRTGKQLMEENLLKGSSSTWKVTTGTFVAALQDEEAHRSHAIGSF